MSDKDNLWTKQEIVDFIREQILREQILEKDTKGLIEYGCGSGYVLGYIDALEDLITELGMRE